jgi:prepilin-type N-terminal cleavage/methylation domain-containing protein
MPKKLSGFTLVELLVVVAVVGVLSGLVIVVLDPAHFRNQAQDSRRISDLGNIQATLELSFADDNQYPTVAEFAALSVPSDPDGGSYEYCVDDATTPMNYQICADMEITPHPSDCQNPNGTWGCSKNCCLTNPF